MTKTVRRSKASSGKACASTPIDGVGRPADALERRAKKKAARRKARRARERLMPRLSGLFPPPPLSGDAALWSVAGLVMGALAGDIIGPAIDKVLAKASDEGLLDVAAASLGHMRLAPVCCFATSREPTPCGKPAPRYFARQESALVDPNRGAELALCEAHAERMRSLMPITDRNNITG